jgi:ABC-type sugar transport system permease subunit
MNFYDISWIKYVTLNILSIGIYILSYITAYYLLADKRTGKRFYTSAILAYFTSLPVGSVVIAGMLVNNEQPLTLISTLLSLQFYGGSGVLISWLKDTYTVVNREQLVRSKSKTKIP